MKSNVRDILTWYSSLINIEYNLGLHISYLIKRAEGSLWDKMFMDDIFLVIISFYQSMSWGSKVSPSFPKIFWRGNDIFERKFWHFKEKILELLEIITN